MDFQVVVSCITTFFYVGFWFLIHFKGKKTTLTKSFNILVLSMIAWSFGVSMFYLTKDPIQSLFWIKFTYFSGTFIPASFLLLSYVYPSGMFVVSPFKRFFIFAPSLLIFCVFFMTPWAIQEIQVINGHKGWSYGPGKYLFDVQFLFLFAWAFKRFFRMYRNLDGDIKNSLRFNIFGTLIALILGGGTNVILIWFNHFEWVWFGPTLCLTWLITVAYAILRYQIMDIHFFIKRSLVYTVSITFMTILYFVAILIVENFFKDIIGYKSFFGSLSSVVLIALVFIPLKNSIQYVIDRYFFRGSFFQIAEQNELLRKEMAQSEKYRTLANLTGGIVHEIKGPLSALKGYSHFLPKKMDDKKFLEKFSVILDNELERINGLVQHLTDYSKPAPLDLRDTNVYKLLDDSLDIMKMNFIEKKVAVVKEYDSQKEFSLHIDPIQINQALIKIYLNVIEAVEMGGKMSIDAQTTDKAFVIRIRDNGCGISKEDLKHIFDPFFSRKEKNSGLGLAIAHAIIESHEGKIEVHSTLKVGTEFLISFPV